jgi:hypothetical protein
MLHQNLQKWNISYVGGDVVVFGQTLLAETDLPHTQVISEELSKQLRLKQTALLTTNRKLGTISLGHTISTFLNKK